MENLFFFRHQLNCFIYYCCFIWISYLYLSPMLAIFILGVYSFVNYLKQKKIYRQAYNNQIADCKIKQQEVKNIWHPNDLPSWIVFPDKEKAEWINIIMKQIWPNVERFIRKFVTNSIEPALRSSLKTFIVAGFEFERFILGRNPPKITGIKVYEKNVHRNEIVLDADFVWASGCDVRLNINKFTVSVSNLCVRGFIRFVLKPLISEIPLVGGIQIYFLRLPQIDFNLGGVVSIIDELGLNSILRDICEREIVKLMVIPNMITLSLSNSVHIEKLRFPDISGVFRVHVIRGRRLKPSDIGVIGRAKTSDPYVVLKIGAFRKESAVISSTLDPIWDFIADFPIQIDQGQYLELQVMDRDSTGKDESLGNAIIPINNANSMWVDLENVKTGQVLLTLSWFVLTKVIPVGLSEDEALLLVYVDSCTNLSLHKNGSLPSPRVILVSPDEIEESRTVFLSTDPVFEESFTLLLKPPLSNQKIVFNVVDTNHNNEKIGSTFIQLSDLVKLEAMSFPLQNMSLGEDNDDTSGTISISAGLMFLQKMPSANNGHKLTDSLKAETVNDEFEEGVRLTLKYNSTKEKLSVVVHSVSNIDMLAENSEIFVKMYIIQSNLSERGNKRKTSSKTYSGCRADFEAESYSYSIAFDELKKLTLEVTVSFVSGKILGVSKATNIGRVYIPLKCVGDCLTSLFPLEKIKSKCSSKPSLSSIFSSSDVTSVSSVDQNVKPSGFLNHASFYRRQRLARNVSLSNSSFGGRIKIGIQYYETAETLTVTIYEAEDLGQVLDSYVKIYILSNNQQSYKRKTSVIKASSQPCFDQEFIYAPFQAKNMTNKQLKVVLMVAGGNLFGRNFQIGRIIINLCDKKICQDNGLCQWYNLANIENNI